MLKNWGSHWRVLLVEVHRQGAKLHWVEAYLSPDDVVGVRDVVRNVGHDCDEHVLLAVERARVERDAGAKDSEADVGKSLLPQLAQGVSEQLGNVGQNRDGWVADGEELVHEGEQGGEEQTDNPRTNGRRRHGGVVVVVDDGAHLRVGRVARDEGGLKLHLLDQSLVLLGVLEDVVVLEESLNLLDNDEREVGVLLVDLVDVEHHVANLLQRHLRSELLGLKQIVLGDVELLLDVLVVVDALGMSVDELGQAT